MWDARLDAIRERKLNEIVIFAGMMKEDPSVRTECLGIINQLNADLEVIDALSKKQVLPESDPIDSKLYRDRLSKMELLDEQEFDMERKSLPAAEEAPEQIKEAEAQEPAADDDEVPEVYDMILDVDDAVILKKTRDMKNAKIDLFIDRAMSGHFGEEACDDVVEFLKVDLMLIDLIMSMNITSKNSIEVRLKEIINFVDESDIPKHQKFYFNSLSKDERALEGAYNKVLKKLEDIIIAKYAYILDDSGSVFFEE